MLFNIYSVVIVEQHKQHNTIYSGKMLKMRLRHYSMLDMLNNIINKSNSYSVGYVGYVEQH